MDRAKFQVTNYGQPIGYFDYLTTFTLPSGSRFRGNLRLRGQ